MVQAIAIGRTGRAGGTAQLERGRDEEEAVDLVAGQLLEVHHLQDVNAVASNQDPVGSEGRLASRTDFVSDLSVPVARMRRSASHSAALGSGPGSAGFLPSERRGIVPQTDPAVRISTTSPL